MKKYILYRVARPILKVFINFFYKIEIINNNNIPKSGRCILAGNHTSNLDPLVLISSTKRTIRFMAKKELHKGLLGPLFTNAGTISVDRKNKDEHAKVEAIKALEEGSVLGIFPEGTINRSNDTILQFKYGAVSFANKTSSPIIPFVITGKYKLFRKNIKIEFLKPYKVSSDLEYENKKLMNLISSKLEASHE